jgi:hypothetical protein
MDACLKAAIESVIEEIQKTQNLDRDRATKLFTCTLYWRLVRCEILDRIDFYLAARKQDVRRRDMEGFTNDAIRLCRAGLFKNNRDPSFDDDLMAALENNDLWAAITEAGQGSDQVAT